MKLQKNSAIYSIYLPTSISKKGYEKGDILKLTKLTENEIVLTKMMVKKNDI